MPRSAYQFIALALVHSRHMSDSLQHRLYLMSRTTKSHEGFDLQIGAISLWIDSFQFLVDDSFLRSVFWRKFNPPWNCALVEVAKNSTNMDPANACNTCSPTSYIRDSTNRISSSGEDTMPSTKHCGSRTALSRYCLGHIGAPKEHVYDRQA
jgi:hypothetical protein